MLIADSASVRSSNYRKIIIDLAESGINVPAVSKIVGCSGFTVRYWIRRYAETGDLNDRCRPGRPAVYTEDRQLRITTFYCQTQPLPNCGRWTARWAALHLKAHPELINISPSKSTIHRILNNNKLKPHQSRYFLNITDPDFFPKMEHLITLYMSPPRFLFFFDECPGIQILKRIAPDFQTEETKKRIEEFEYTRNGTMDVFAFLNHSDGKLYTEIRRDHTTSTFVDVFRRHASAFVQNEQLNYVMDNLASHCSYQFCRTVAELSGIECPPEKKLNSQLLRTQWLRSDKKKIVIHFTPYHGSWLNLVEIWFGIMGMKVLKESFCTPESFIEAFNSFVDEWNYLPAHPFRWTYKGNGLHESAVKRFTKMLHNSVEQMELRILTKSFGLMKNLLNNYFSEVSKESWEHLADTVTLQFETISKIIHKESGAKRKEKAIIEFNDFIVALNRFLLN